MWWTVLLISGCSYIGDAEHAARLDQDGDGLVAVEYEGGTDCDDQDASVGEATAFYADKDGDDWGAGDAVLACEAPTGHVAVDGDCDDGDDDVHPDTDEICDGVDNDCDDAIDDLDDDVVDQSTFYVDGDGDGYGLTSDALSACELPSGYAEVGEDCDDADADVHPDAEETCDDVDQDCDDTVDEDPTDATVYYADGDSDGFGDDATAESFCDDPGSGYVVEGGDCDDAEAEANPDGVEVCDGIDNDCDDEIDPDGLADGTWAYPDDDGDGYGVDTEGYRTCELPTGYVTEDEDCDDADADVYPGADELCDEVDQDCDDDVDEDPTDGDTFYADADGDGYGDPDDSTVACEAPSDYVDNDEDCDDTRSGSSPDGTEKCNYRDDDCDGDTDESGASNASTWYLDSDGDGYGDSSSTTVACWEPSGYCDNDEDCDDSSSAVSPDEVEVCANSVDDDCDSATDEECVGSNCFDDTGIIADITYELNTGTLTGTDSSSGSYYYDDWEFEGFSGDELGLHLYSDAFDASVELYDETCTLVDSDDSSARGDNSWLEFSLSADGIYTVVVTSSTASATGDYVLELLDMSVAVGDNCDVDGVAFDLLTATTDSTTSALTTGDSSFSTGEYYDDIEYFSFYGDTVTSDETSNDFDAFLMLADPDCSVIASNDDGAGGTDSRIQQSTNRTGIYTLVPSTFYSSTTGLYTVSSEVTW